MPSVYASVMNLSTYLGHGNYHFEEAEGIRKEQLEAIERARKFGLSFENAFPKIASSVGLGAISDLTLTKLLNVDLELGQPETDAIIVAFIGIGCLLTELVVMPISICRNKHAINYANLVKSDYYDLYVDRCKRELDDLFTTLRIARKNAYDEDYPISRVEGDKKWSVEQVVPDNEDYEIEHVSIGRPKEMRHSLTHGQPLI